MQPPLWNIHVYFLPLLSLFSLKLCWQPKPLSWFFSIHRWAWAGWEWKLCFCGDCLKMRKGEKKKTEWWGNRYELHWENFAGKPQSIRICCGNGKVVLDALKMGLEAWWFVDGLSWHCLGFFFFFLISRDFFISLQEDIFNLQPSKRVSAGNICFSLNSCAGKEEEGKLWVWGSFGVKDALISSISLAMSSQFYFFLPILCIKPVSVDLSA